MVLKDRIKRLVDDGHTRAALAKAAGVTAASVTHWLNGDTKTIKSESAAGLQALTGFNAVWIATGEGPKRAGEPAKADASIDGVLLALRGFLNDADPEDREALQGLFANLVRKPLDNRIQDAIKVMLCDQALQKKIANSK